MVVNEAFGPVNPTISISDEMRKSYLDYAMSVIVSRALPDVRDGLKPVHRRILYAMMEGNYDWSKPPRKSARVVGDVMGNYHPHGDSSIYEAMVRMAQDFSMRLPLVDGQGNFGSVDGDPAAAMRYTESRLARAAESLLRDIDKDTVEFTQNYDETQLEPTVLPAEYPNLLVNGANGIAVGMATNIPPHNPVEVITACEAYVQNPDITAEALIEIVPGPDFPTGGLIMGRQGIREGVVRDADARAEAIMSVLWAAHDVGLAADTIAPSPLAGVHGNLEFLAVFRPAVGRSPTQWREHVDALAHARGV